MGFPRFTPTLSRQKGSLPGAIGTLPGAKAGTFLTFITQGKVAMFTGCTQGLIRHDDRIDHRF
jgi:hypothetical protein